MRRLYNNMLGNDDYHAFALRSLKGTTESVKFLLAERTSELSYEVRNRAASYMMFKETQSSFDIENESEKKRYPDNSSPFAD